MGTSFYQAIYPRIHQLLLQLALLLQILDPMNRRLRHPNLTVVRLIAGYTKTLKTNTEKSRNVTVVGVQITGSPNAKTQTNMITGESSSQVCRGALTNGQIGRIAKRGGMCLPT